MPFVSVSFDDPDEDPLWVFSGGDLLIGHYDQVDLDWEEVAERTAIDERRGLVVTQVAVLEDLLDELILYLADPEDIDRLRGDLAGETIGPRITRLERLLTSHGLLDGQGADIVQELRTLVALRNRLAHGTIARQATPSSPSGNGTTRRSNSSGWSSIDVPAGPSGFRWRLFARRSCRPRDASLTCSGSPRHLSNGRLGRSTSPAAGTWLHLHHEPSRRHVTAGRVRAASWGPDGRWR